MRDWEWSRAEKAAARRAFDLALDREFETVIREAKERAARIAKADELWKLERWLAARRREIDRRYDYRYSVLPLVFGELLRLGRIREEDLTASLRIRSRLFGASGIVDDLRGGTWVRGVAVMGDVLFRELCLVRYTVRNGRLQKVAPISRTARC